MPTPKKSETLEIRLSHGTKQAFMARCGSQGRTASEALRGFIEAEIAARPRPRRRLHLAAGVLAAAGLAVVALPSLARPSPTAEFERLDVDRDGRLSLSELSTGSGLQVQVPPTGARVVDAAAKLHAADQARLKSLVIKAVFDRLDADGDGTVTPSEYARSLRSVVGSGPSAAASPRSRA